MKVFLSSLILALCFGQAVVAIQDEPSPRIATIYDSIRDKTIVTLLPVKISGPKAQYHSIHIAPSFTYPGRDFQKPQLIYFEVKTVVTTKLKIDLYVVFVVDGEEIFLSSENRSAVMNPVPGKKWIGERLIFRMPYDTLTKITKAKSVEIKMDGVRFPIEEPQLEMVREFAQRLE